MMSLRVITAPEPVVSWEQAKAHLRLDSDEEKAYVEGLTAAATGWVDGPSGWLGRCLGPQLLEWSGQLCASRIRLPMGPVLEIDSIITDAESDSPDTVDPDLYTLAADGTLVIVEGAAWVTEPDHRVRYWAGYGSRDPDDAGSWIAEVPAPVQQAILLLVGHWYANREEVVTGTITATVPMAADALLSTYRVFN